MVTRITLVRHGETAWNADGRWQGHAHVPLNPAGRRQAELLAEHLAESGTRFHCVVSSDSVRASETGATVASKLGIPLELDPRLRELDIGEWQGLTADEVRRWDPQRYLEIEHDPYHRPRPGGESGAQSGARAALCLEELAARAGGTHCVAVSHGGTIRNLLQHLGLGRADRVVVGNTSLSVFVHEVGADGLPRWSLEAFNEMPHLGGVAARIEVEP